MPMPHSTNGTSMLHYASASTLLISMTLLTPGDRGQVADGWQGTTLSSSYLRDALGHPGYIARWVAHIGKGYKGLSTSRAWSKDGVIQGIGKEMPDSAGTPTSPKREFSTIVLYLGWATLIISCTVFFISNILLPFLVFCVARFSSNPGFLWLILEVGQPHWPPLIDLVQSRNRAQKNGA